MSVIKVISFDLLDTLVDQRGTLSAAKLYPDTSAILELKRSVYIGLVGAGEYKQVQAAQQLLGFAVDFCLIHPVSNTCTLMESTSKEAQHYIERELQCTTASWLHVSSQPTRDLSPVKALGAQTCFIPRPHLSNAFEADDVKPSLAVSDLFQLHEGIRNQIGAPRAWTLTLSAPHPKLIRELMRWLRHDDNLPVHPKLSTQVSRPEPHLAELRLIGPPPGDAALDAKLELFFSALSQTFPEELLQQKMQLSEVLLEA